MMIAQASAAGDEAPFVSVVVPVRNEAGNVGPLIEEIAASLAGKGSFEVVYVDDGSTDGTAAEIDRLMQDRPWLRHVGHAVSCGQSAAVRTGVAAARAAACRHARRRRAERSGLPAGSDRKACAESAAVGLVAGQRVGRKATGFKKLQSRIANTVRGARAAGRHSRHRLRPESVPPRRVSGVALFRRAASFPAGPVPARRS